MKTDFRPGVKNLFVSNSVDTLLLDLCRINRYISTRLEIKIPNGTQRRGYGNPNYQ